MQLALEAYEEWLARHKEKKSLILEFGDAEGTFESWLSEMKLGTDKGKEFAEAILAKGVKFLGSKAESSLVEELVKSLEPLKGKATLGIWIDQWQMVSIDDIIKHVSDMDAFGKHYVKDFIQGMLEVEGA